MLTNNEKRIIENTIESQVLASSSGINTLTLMQAVYGILHEEIPNMNQHHIAGMISWVCRSRGYRTSVKALGDSVIV